MADQAAAGPRSRASRRQELLIAMLYGACCHLCFVAGVGTMMVMMFFGMSRSHGMLPAPWSHLANLLLLAQFLLAHSMLLSRRGHGVLHRLAPFGLGSRLASITYALIASVQVWLLFALWTPSGIIWWQAGGSLFGLFCGLYAAAWLLLLKSIVDAGFASQIGLLGWRAVARHANPTYPPMPATGLFRRVPAAHLCGFLADALDGADAHAGPACRVADADRLLPGRPAVQGGAVHADVRRAIHPLPADGALLAALAAAGKDRGMAAAGHPPQRPVDLRPPS
jgi:hypothetical protein